MIKLRTVSLLLALLVAVCVLLPAFAADNRNAAMEETLVENAESIGTEPESEFMLDIEVEAEAGKNTLRAPFYLNGECLSGLVYVYGNDVTYVTVASFVAVVDPEAVVEEMDGSVVVSSTVLREVVSVQNGESAAVVEDVLDFSVSVGDFYVCANDRYLYLEKGATAIDGNVALPIDVLAQIFNLDVTREKHSVWLSKATGVDAYLENGDDHYDENLLYWLSRIIYSESGNQSMEGKIAVGNVVMNRLNSPDFPDTIKGVLFQKNQFSPAMSGSIYRTPNESSVLAAKLVLDGAEVLEGVLFFNRAGMNTFASRNRTFVATIGGHSFYA